MLKQFLIRLLIERAISFEEQAYRFYEALLNKMIMKDSFDLVKKLMAEELRHRMMLEEAAKRGDIGYLGVKGRLGEDKCSEDKSLEGPMVTYESPAMVLLDKGDRRFMGNIDDFEEICAPWPDPAMLSTSKEILEFALRKEKCALHFYASMCRKRKMRVIRDVFCALSYAEEQHVKWVSSELEAFL